MGIWTALSGATFTWGMYPPCTAQKKAQMAVNKASLDWAPAKTGTQVTRQSQSTPCCDDDSSDERDDDDDDDDDDGDDDDVYINNLIFGTSGLFSQIEQGSIRHSPKCQNKIY